MKMRKEKENIEIIYNYDGDYMIINLVSFKIHIIDIRNILIKTT